MSQDSIRDCPPGLREAQGAYLLGELKCRTADLDKARAELEAARAAIAKLTGAVEYVGRSLSGPADVQTIWVCLDVLRAALSEAKP